MNRVIRHSVIIGIALAIIPITASAFSIYEFSNNTASLILAQINTNLPVPKSPQVGATCGGKLTISWAPVTSEKVVAYKLTRSTSGENNTYSEIVTISANDTEAQNGGRFSYTDSVTVGKKYFYRIRSVGGGGNVSIAADVSGKSLACVTAPVVAEDAPEALPETRTTTQTTQTTQTIQPSTASTITTYASRTEILPLGTVTATLLNNLTCPSIVHGATLHGDTRCFVLSAFPPFYSDIWSTGYFNNNKVWYAFPKPKAGAGVASQPSVAAFYNGDAGTNYARLRYAPTVGDSPLVYYDTQSANGQLYDRYRYLCSGIPANFGCYYVDQSFNGSPRYGLVIPAFTPAPVNTFKISCTAVAEKFDENGPYKNVKWTATATGEGENTRYKWTGDATHTSTGDTIRTYVYPATGKIAKGTVVAITTIDDKVVTSNIATCQVTPPPNKASLTCSAEAADYTDPVSGEYKNVKWIAKEGFGDNYRYKWTGAVTGTTKEEYSFVESGQTVTAKIAGSATFNGANRINTTTVAPANSCSYKSTQPALNLKVLGKESTTTARMVTWGVSLKAGDPFDDIKETFLEQYIFPDDFDIRWDNGSTETTDVTEHADITAKTTVTNKVKVNLKAGLFENSEKITRTQSANVTLCPELNTSIESSVRCYLSKLSVGVNAASPKTQVKTLSKETLDKVAALAKALGSVVITGGTETFPHKTHGPNIQVVDLRKASALNTYIKGKTNWTRNSGFGMAHCVDDASIRGIYVNEDSKHWHVIYGLSERRAFMDSRDISADLGCYN